MHVRIDNRVQVHEVTNFLASDYIVDGFDYEPCCFLNARIRVAEFNSLVASTPVTEIRTIIFDIEQIFLKKYKF